MSDYFGPHDFKGEWTQDKKIVFNKRPEQPWQAMPVGTGRIGVAVWAPSGLMLQINHTDYFSPDANVPGLLRLEIDSDGQPFRNCVSWEQELRLADATVNIIAHTADGDIRTRIFAHKELDVIIVEIEDLRPAPANISVILYQWRQNVCGHLNGDICGCGEMNRFSAFDSLNRMTGVSGHYEDPLTGMGYACAVKLDGPDTETSYNMIREMGGAGNRFKRILITAATGRNGGGLDGLFAVADAKLERAAAMPGEEAYRRHCDFWKGFWDRSRVDLAEDSAMRPVQAAWYMQRYFAASSMDGLYPPKFNGSAFLYHYDSRPWGGFYVLQNQRFMYWSLLKSGDGAYLKQYFGMMARALDYARDKVKTAYGHGGAAFFESMNFWGASVADDLREDDGFVCGYHMNHWTGTLELLMMMLEYHRYEPDEAFAREMLLPAGEAFLDFFWQHGRVSGGRLTLEKQNALETWWLCDDPADQVAGIRAAAPRLLEVALKAGAKQALTAKLRRYCEELPELACGKMIYEGGPEAGFWHGSGPGDDILPARAIHDPVKHNTEDPELYSVWPFGLFGAGQPGLDAAVSTFNNKIYKRPRQGWNQHAIWAARLGLKDEAYMLALRHFAYNAACPGGMFTSVGAAYPGRPDIPECPFFDAPGVLATAMNEMLMHDHTGEITLLPAWPDAERGKVSFKLHAAGGRTVEY